MRVDFQARTNVLWRYWSKVQVAGPNACWEWVGAKTFADYSNLRLGNKNIHAHVASWQMAHGQARPPKTVVMHLCDNPPCVNPEHLKLGTNKENLLHAAELASHKIGARAVPVIRFALGEGASANHLRKLWDVRHRSITNIRGDKTYTWVMKEAA